MVAMKRNLIVAYAARVGSSALIDTLSHTPGFSVPIFEELDWYSIEKRGLGKEQTPENIHRVVGYMLEDQSKLFPENSIAFKWRLFGDPEKLAEVMRRHQIVLLNMTRSELLELVSSRYLSDVVHRDFNAAQFAYRDAADQREDILTRYRLTMVSVDLNVFFSLCDSIVQVELERMAFLAELQRLGVTVYTALYEDFAYKRFRFMNKLLLLLGHPTLSCYPKTELTKISTAYPHELFSNAEDVLSSPKLLRRLSEWEQLVYGGPFETLSV